MAEVAAEVVTEVMHGNGGENGRGGAFGYSPTTGKAYETLAKTQWHASLDDSPKPKKKLKLDKETVE